MNNKKIKNATSMTINNITFKSKLEANCYRLFTNAGIHLEYESKKFVLVDKINNFTNTNYYCRYKPKGKLETFGLFPYSIRTVEYTPDFYVIRNGIELFLETKGYPNDAYPIKKKLFLNLLNNQGRINYFFELKTIKDIEECIEIILNI